MFGLTFFFFFFQAEDGIRDYKVTGVQTCALPISSATSVCFQSLVENQAYLQGVKLVSFNWLKRVLHDHGSPLWDDENVGRESGNFVPEPRQWKTGERPRRCVRNWISRYRGTDSEEKSPRFGQSRNRARRYDDSG